MQGRQGSFWNISKRIKVLNDTFHLSTPFDSFGIVRYNNDNLESNEAFSADSKFTELIHYDDRIQASCIRRRRTVDKYL